MKAKDIDKIIGGNLRRLREGKTISQKEIAEMVDETREHISDMERGSRGVGKELLARLCTAMNVEPWEFYLTDKAPVVLTREEGAALRLLREARVLGVAEKVLEYGSFEVQRKAKRPVPIHFDRKQQEALDLFERAERVGLVNDLISDAEKRIKEAEGKSGGPRSRSRRSK